MMSIRRPFFSPPFFGTFLAIAILLASCGSSTNYDHTGLCADWEEFSIGDYLFQNNVWGKGSISDYEQCLFEASGGGFPAGWHWIWPQPGGGVKAYPEVIFGHKPWNASSTTLDLPVQLSEDPEITAAYDITQDASGSYNLAFDIWLTSTNPPTGNTITREIMIWLDRNIIVAAGTFQETVTIDSESYDFYRADFADWTYLAFVKTAPEFSGNTRIDLFFDYLVGEGHITAAEYCASIEFGNEVISGSGQTELTSYSVTIN